MRRPPTLPIVVGVAVMTLIIFQGIIPQSEAKKGGKSKGGRRNSIVSKEVPPGTMTRNAMRDMNALPPIIQETMKAFQAVKGMTIVDKLSPSEKNYVGAVNKCADKIKLCPHTSLSASMCSYTETVFDGMMRTFDTDIRTVEQFLNLHHSSLSDGGKVHAYTAAGAVNFQIIKLSNLTSFDGLKLFLGSIYASNAAAKVANIGFSDRDVENIVCSHVDYSDSTQRLAEEMISKPTLSDLILEGYFSLSHVVRLGSFGPAAPLLQATMSVLKALTGVECGLLDFVATGTTINCTTIAGKKRVNVKPSKNMKSGDDDPICGVKMDIPPVELGQKFPRAYPFNVLDKVNVYDYVDRYADAASKGGVHEEEPEDEIEDEEQETGQEGTNGGAEEEEVQEGADDGADEGTDEGADEEQEE